MDEIRKVAEDEIRISYIIDAIAEKESIKAEEAELEKELEATARYMSLSLDKLKEKYGKDSLYRAASKGIIENKVYELIQGQAKITEKKEASK
jgi:FKBP-type peptidyl-prolyl cis-trans isomerase (trigger factor)